MADTSLITTVIVDPSIRQLLKHRDEEQENLSFIELAKAAEREVET